MQWVGCIDLTANEVADLSITVDKDQDCAGQAASVMEALTAALGETGKVDAFINVAGGWAGGSAAAKGKNLVTKRLPT